MSNYVKSTNFAVKDNLLTGDPDKKIKGTEIDTEFNNIATAVGTKANTASPTLTGTPLAPTASSGTNTTQLATTAFVTTAVTDATSSLGTMSTQNASAVVITGGTIAGTTVNSVTVGTNGAGAKTISTSSPTGGSNGDVWYKVAS